MENRVKSTFPLHATLTRYGQGTAHPGTHYPAVINRRSSRNAIFRAKRDYGAYLDLLERYREKFPVRIYHFVLMTNHVHLLLEPKEDGVLSQFMQGLTLAHTRLFNNIHRTIGHVWQGRFKSIPVDTDEYLLQCGRYIELNPVRAKMVSHPKDYPWSSYHAYAVGASSSIVDPSHHPLYNDLAQTDATRRKRYQQFVEGEIEASKQGRARRFSEQLVYGGSSFLQDMKNRFDLAPFPRPTGRPRE